VDPDPIPHMVSLKVFRKPRSTFLRTSRRNTEIYHDNQDLEKMGDKTRKREREADQAEKVDEAPPKRRRQFNEEHLKLIKLYDDLAAEDDDVRLEAAKQLIIKFSPENKPSAKDVETVLVRLIRGLCSQRKAARVGFSLTLTELLRQIFGATKNEIEGLKLDVSAIIKMVEEKTKVEGNVPGKVRLQPAHRPFPY
jgi:DNA polymerase phi